MALKGISYEEKWMTCIGNCTIRLGDKRVSHDSDGSFVRCRSCGKKWRIINPDHINTVHCKSWFIVCSNCYPMECEVYSFPENNEAKKGVIVWTK
jgi:hypothetical protein